MEQEIVDGARNKNTKKATDRLGGKQQIVDSAGIGGSVKSKGGRSTMEEARQHKAPAWLDIVKWRRIVVVSRMDEGNATQGTVNNQLTYDVVIVESLRSLSDVVEKRLPRVVCARCY